MLYAGVEWLPLTEGPCYTSFMASAERHVMSMKNICGLVNGRKNMTAQIICGNFQLSVTQPSTHTLAGFFSFVDLTQTHTHQMHMNSLRNILFCRSKT